MGKVICCLLDIEGIIKWFLGGRGYYFGSE